jgi:hypothetical protein
VDVSNLPRIVALLALVLVGFPTAARLVSGPAAGERPAGETWEELQDQAADIARAKEDAADRHAFNRLLFTRLANGHVSLPEAVETHWAANHATLGFVETLPNYPGTSAIEVRQRLNVLRLVRVHLTDDPDRDKIMARLLAEYEKVYGPFPLRSVDDLPGDTPGAIR